MREKEAQISDLPTDLEQLVYMFAFNVPKTDVLWSVREMIEIKKWNLPFWFLNRRIWSWHYRTYLTSPLISFLPIEYFGGNYKDIFDLDVIYSFLLSLDFRRKNVRAFGSRKLWETRILVSWRTIESLSYYYKMLLRSKTKVLRKNTFYEEHYVIGKPTRL